MDDFLFCRVRTKTTKEGQVNKTYLLETKVLRNVWYEIIGACIQLVRKYSMCLSSWSVLSQAQKFNCVI